jgi:hypothetical protein
MATPEELSRRRFSLEIGGEIIAVIKVDGIDFPWTYGHLVNTSKFERFRPYFTDATSWPEEDSDLDALCAEVRAKGGFILNCLETGERFTNVFLNRDDDVVWFRYYP